MTSCPFLRLFRVLVCGAVLKIPPAAHPLIAHHLRLPYEKPISATIRGKEIYIEISSDDHVVTLFVVFLTTRG